ncbi:MAG: signal peptide peptidase SppA [Nocardioidaceae bacterium]
MPGPRGKWLVVIAALLLIAAALGVILSGGGAGRRWDEEVLSPGGPDKVAVVRIAGQIGSTGGLVTPGASPDEIVGQLDRASTDERVKAVIVELDTPGGGVVASDTIYAKVRQVRRRKPVIALMEDVAASGGYYIAAGANEVVANGASLTGSIGVILLVPNVQRAADKLGIEPVVIKSGPYKDIASPFREMTPEEHRILQTLIDEAYAQFVSVVAAGRRLDPARVREIGDGRVYTGRQARELGLVDYLGGRDRAFARARTLAHTPRASLVRYTRRRGLFERVLGLTSGIGARLPAGVDVELRPGLKYLWIP